MWGYIIAILSGVLMSVQGVFNTGVTQKAGLWITAAFVQLTALLVCIIAWFVTGKEGSISALIHFDKKYMLLGGIMGAFITYTVVKATEALQPARAVIFIVTAQLIVAYLIELFGLFGIVHADFQWRKLIGLAVIIFGIILFKWD